MCMKIILGVDVVQILAGVLLLLYFQNVGGCAPIPLFHHIYSNTRTCIWSLVILSILCNKCTDNNNNNNNDYLLL